MRASRIAVLLSLAQLMAGAIGRGLPVSRSPKISSLRHFMPVSGLGLRGGCAAERTAASATSDAADAAATEEQELLVVSGRQKPASNEDTTCSATCGNGQSGSSASSIEEILREHLKDVEGRPGDYIAHPEPGSLRFRICDAATLAAKFPGIASASTTLQVTRRRNAWQRFYPLDLAVLLPDILDTEEIFDEEGEMGQARTLAVLAGAPSGAIATNSVVSPWAWATQKIKFRDGSEGTARLLFAQEEAGVIMWSLQRGKDEAIVERVQISQELEATGEGNKVSITWTSVKMQALKQLPEFAREDPNTAPAACATHTSAEDEMRLHNALKRLKRIMGQSEESEAWLHIRPFAAGRASVGLEGRSHASPEGHEKTLVLAVEKNVWVESAVADLKVGDVVKVAKTQKFPADLLLLDASSPTEVCIETSCFDNDSALRHWQCMPMALKLAALGSGDTTLTGALRASDTTIKARPARIPAEWESWQALLCVKSAANEPASDAFGTPPHTPLQNVTFNYRQLLPCGAKLLVTEWVVGVVLFQGEDTCVALSGGSAACGRQARRLALQKKHETAVKEATKQKLCVEEAARAPQDASDFEAATGIKWRSCFTDVPDDGNCLMHAVWLGLTTLLKSYPALGLADEAALPASAIDFRLDAVKRMRADARYKEAVGNQLMLWVSVECDLLFGLEDFFCLPPHFQSRVIEYNQQVQMGGAEASQLDMEQLVEDYMSALTQAQRDGERSYHLPLGELEIDALCRLYHIRLHVIKTEAIDLIIESQNKAAPRLSHSDEQAITQHVVPALTAIKAEVTPWEAAREAIDTVLLYVANILDNPQDDKFKVLKKGNAALQRRVLSKPSAHALLLKLGFVEQVNAEGQEVLKLKDSLPPHPGPSWFPAARRAIQTFLFEQGDVTRVIDPRTIRPEHYLDRNSENKRIVRILNVRTNHYQVHLPRAPA